MSSGRSLPIIFPQIDGQRWSCHSCGYCCRELVVHLTAGDRERIDQLGWAEKIEIAPYVRLGSGWALNKTADGACVFLDVNTRCRIHNENGEQSKPLACRMFPFSARATDGGWIASFRYDCPSMAGSKGEPVAASRGPFKRLVNELDHSPPVEAVLLQRGVPATHVELEAITGHLIRWFSREDISMHHRLLGAARLVSTLSEATLKHVRGERFVELLDLLIAALPVESTTAVSPPTRRQRGLLRQLVFTHTEHLSLAETQSGVLDRFSRKWRQVRQARCFLRGMGMLPPISGLDAAGSFEQVESVGPVLGRVGDVEQLLLRYLEARLKAWSVFGAGYYGWSVLSGLGAFFLSVSAVGWLGRCIAASAGRSSLTFDDVACALGIVDRAATRLPALSTMTERGRVSYLLSDDGLASLIGAYSLVGERA